MAELGAGDYGEDAVESSYQRAIVDTVRHSMLVLTDDLRIEFANASFLSTFRMPLERVVGASIFDLGNGAWNVAALRTLLTEVLPRDREVIDYRLEHTFENLGRRIMLVSARRLARENEDDRILVAIVDVTEQEETRAALESNAELLGKVFDASRESLVILGFDLRVHSANDTFYNTFQVRPEDTRGQPLFALGNGQWDIPELRSLLETIIPRDASFNDFEVTHDFEGIGRKSMILNARRIDHLQLILLAIEDATERRRSREELEESAETAEALVMASGQAIWETDSAGFVRKDSPSWRAATGRSVDDWMARCWLSAVHPDDCADAQAQWRAALAQERPMDAEFRVLTASGGWRWTNVRAAPIRGASGAVKRWVGMNIDVDDRHKAESARELLLAEVNHRVKNLLAIVTSIAQQGSDANSKEEFQRDLVARLRALASAHDVALKAEWGEVDF